MQYEIIHSDIIMSEDFKNFSNEKKLRLLNVEIYSQEIFKFTLDLSEIFKMTNL